MLTKELNFICELNKLQNDKHIVTYKKINILEFIKEQNFRSSFSSLNSLYELLYLFDEDVPGQFIRRFCINQIINQEINSSKTLEELHISQKYMLAYLRINGPEELQELRRTIQLSHCLLIQDYASFYGVVEQMIIWLEKNFFIEIKPSSHSHYVYLGREYFKSTR